MGLLRVRVGDHDVAVLELVAERSAAVPVFLNGGDQTITLTLQDGRPRPENVGGP